MKNLFLIIAFAFIAGSLYSEEVDFKKGIVYVAGKECMKYEGNDPKGYSFSSLQGEEIIYMHFAKSRRVDVYWQIVFLK